MPRIQAEEALEAVLIHSVAAGTHQDPESVIRDWRELAGVRDVVIKGSPHLFEKMGIRIERVPRGPRDGRANPQG